jgi:hypothetical protein
MTSDGCHTRAGQEMEHIVTALHLRWVADRAGQIDGTDRRPDLEITDARPRISITSGFTTHLPIYGLYNWNILPLMPSTITLYTKCNVVLRPIEYTILHNYLIYVIVNNARVTWLTRAHKRGLFWASCLGRGKSKAEGALTSLRQTREREQRLGKGNGRTRRTRAMVRSWKIGQHGRRCTINRAILQLTRNCSWSHHFGCIYGGRHIS